MAEKPYIVTDNIFSDSTVTVTASLSASTGYAVSYVYDNQHYTSFLTSSATSPLSFTATLSTKQFRCNCVIVDTKFADAGGYYVITIDGVTITDTTSTQEITEGRRIFTFSTVTVTSTIVVSFYSAKTTKEIRHIWAGQYREVPNPIYDHDPEEDITELISNESEEGIILRHSPKKTNKILRATWNNISPSDFTNLDYLRSRSQYSGTPFWFFFRPTTYPASGYLYDWEDGGFFRPYTNGAYKSLSVNARAPYLPDRSPNLEEFVYTKGLDLERSSSQYVSHTSFDALTTHTIECRVKFESISASQFICGRPSTSDYLEVTSSGVSYSAGGSTVSFTYIFSTATNYHIMIVRSETSVSLYVNNSLVSSQTLGANNNFEIDREGYYSGVNYLDGIIGHFRVAKWAYTSANRSSAYNSGSGTYALDGRYYIVLEFNGTGGTSTTETDQSGNGLTGTINGGATRANW